MKRSPDTNPNTQRTGGGTKPLYFASIADMDYARLVLTTNSEDFNDIRYLNDDGTPVLWFVNLCALMQRSRGTKLCGSGNYSADNEYAAAGAKHSAFLTPDLSARLRALHPEWDKEQRDLFEIHLRALSDRILDLMYEAAVAGNKYLSPEYVISRDWVIDLKCAGMQALDAGAVRGDVVLDEADEAKIKAHYRAKCTGIVGDIPEGQEPTEFWHGDTSGEPYTNIVTVSRPCFTKKGEWNKPNHFDFGLAEPKDPEAMAVIRGVLAEGKKVYQQIKILDGNGAVTPHVADPTVAKVEQNATVIAQVTCKLGSKKQALRVHLDVISLRVLDQERPDPATKHAKAIEGAAAWALPSFDDA